jgi:hypothetical protein
MVCLPRLLGFLLAIHYITQVGEVLSSKSAMNVWHPSSMHYTIFLSTGPVISTLLSNNLLEWLLHVITLECLLFRLGNKVRHLHQIVLVVFLSSNNKSFVVEFLMQFSKKINSLISQYFRISVIRFS